MGRDDRQHTARSLPEHLANSVVPQLHMAKSNKERRNCISVSFVWCEERRSMLLLQDCQEVECCFARQLALEVRCEKDSVGERES